MRRKATSWLWLAGVLTGMAGWVSAGEFAAPAEGPVPFRRDRIPLDAEAIAGLSGKLEELARGFDAKTPADLRGAAQMLALALALDPGNTKARDLVSEYQKNQHKPAADAAQLEAGRGKIRQTIAWLETHDAGGDGQALAACLKDVVRVSDTEHPEVESGEQGAWAGWIPEISAYETKEVVKNSEPKESAASGQAAKTGILLEKAHVETLFWQRAGKTNSSEWMLAPGPLQMSVERVENDEEGGSRFSILIGNRMGAGAFEQTGASLNTLLRKLHGNLPNGVRIQITSPEFEKSVQSRKRQTISAAAAVLADSAISGREPEGVILGQIDETGAFKLPRGFWDELQALGKGRGQRLVLPAEAAAYLPSVLAMEKPEFFLEYEVLLASDFKQLLDLTAKVPEEPLASATAKFRGIHERAGNQDVRQYIANSFVKQRLAAVLQDMPTHVSAKMLLIQASGNRPVLVSRPVLAAELRRALEPMAWIVNISELNVELLESQKVNQTYDLCRDKVDGLERYAEKADRDLLERAREVVVAIRTLERATRTRGGTYLTQEAVQTAQSSLMQDYARVNTELAAEAKDGPQTPSQ